ncbi:MAG: ATP-dependent DNA ligase [Epsilonproteobacteria bacterium]|nr:ATP-dependent DNA ligase [Campylobacterota bacterium]
MKFVHVAQAFEEIEQESARLTMTKLLADLFSKASPAEAGMIAYLTLGSLKPPYMQVQFNFAQKSMNKVLAQLLGYSLQAISKQAARLGDSGSIAAQGDWQRSSHIDQTLEYVYGALSDFLELTGRGSQEAKEAAMLSLLKKLDPVSAKFVIRIILGKLRLGFSDMTLLDAFSWMEVGDKSLRKELEHAYNICADIGLIVIVLKEKGKKGLASIDVTPGIPIRPAAAERLKDAKAVIKKIGMCVAQPKIDGFRLQIHVDKNKNIRFFSRNLQDMTDMFPDLYDAVKNLNVDSLIAEGEAIAFDPNSGNFLPFQETVKRKRKYDVEKFVEDYPLKLYLFDCLYVNGQSLLDKPHHDRRDTLLDLCPKKITDSTIVLPIQEIPFNDSDSLQDYFDEVIALGLEGLVVKRRDAPYQPGKRNFNWIKLKKTHSKKSGVQDTLDCVIVGYYHGRGKRAALGIGALLVAVYDEKKDNFATVAKIGTGLSDEEWVEYKKACDQYAVNEKPVQVVCSKELHPDVWVAPKLVCVVYADELTRSPLHQAGKTSTKRGIALRFPRIVSQRSDKSPTHATTVEELISLYELQSA